MAGAGWVRVRTNGKERIVFIPQELRPYLDEYLAASDGKHGPGSLLFPSTHPGGILVRSLSRDYMLRTFERAKKQMA